MAAWLFLLPAGAAARSGVQGEHVEDDVVTVDGLEASTAAGLAFSAVLRAARSAVVFSQSAELADIQCLCEPPRLIHLHQGPHLEPIDTLERRG